MVEGCEKGRRRLLPEREELLHFFAAHGSPIMKIHTLRKSASTLGCVHVDLVRMCMVCCAGVKKGAELPTDRRLVACKLGRVGTGPKPQRRRAGARVKRERLRDEEVTETFASIRERFQQLPLARTLSGNPFETITTLAVLKRRRRSSRCACPGRVSSSKQRTAEPLKCSANISNPVLQGRASGRPFAG